MTSFRFQKPITPMFLLVIPKLSSYARRQATFDAMWWLSLVPLLLAAEYDPLTVLVLSPPSFPKLEAKIERGIQEAVIDFHSKINVLRQTTTFLEPNALRECVPNGESKLVAVDIETGRSTSVDVSAGVPLHGYNFVLIAELNAKVCTENPLLLASAKPCGVKDGQRPLIGFICDGPRWNAFKASKDLFRHEILHSLGFGTILPKSYDLFDGHKNQKAIRHYMDFAKATLPLVQAHFNCPLLKGLEADSEDRIHLNKYVFGNELMTPKLSNNENRFSFLSATILEQTYVGNSPWYKINRTSVALENYLYWYGRGWGCQFAIGSCHDFSKFPFCSAEDLSKVLKTTYCIRHSNGKVQKFTSKCSFTPMKPNSVADNGIRPSSLSFVDRNLAGFTGSDPLYRFCPMAQDFLNERVQLTKGASIVECA